MVRPIATTSAAASGSGSGAATGATQTTAKAFFMPDPEFMIKFPRGRPPIPTLVCRYNPTTLKIAGGGEWKKFKSTTEHDKPTAQFSNPKPRTLTVDLLVDMFELPYGNLEWELQAIEDWSEPRLSADGQQASAVHLRFQWGEKRWFKCYIKSYSIEYTLFSKSGAPMRAKVNLQLEEAVSPTEATNPTSGGPGGERSYVTRAGDTYHSIAYRHYGQARYWRGLADFNGADDPMRLGTGEVVSLPELSTITELS